MDSVEDMLAQTPFVGREQEQKLYLKKFLTNDTPWVLIITGLGGIGKTTLLEHLAQDTPKDIAVLRLDFNQSALRTNSLEILKRLVKQIQPYISSQQCEPLLAAIAHDQQQLEQAKNIKFPLHDDGIVILDGKADLGKDDAATKEIELQMRETLIEDFYEQIDTLQLNRFVLMLDTCEMLSESDGWEIGQWVLNDLVPELHNRMQLSEKQCFVIIASRFKPQLGRIDRQDQQQVALAMLDKNAVDQYLVHVGMEDAKLRQRVYDITHGHALSVSIIGSICREQGAKSFSEADFPILQEEFNEQASMKFVNERILERLKSPYRELTRYGVLLRSFNLPMLRAVFPELLPESEAATIFEQLVRYPYIESFGNYTYSFHELLREIIADKTQQQEGPEKEQWKQYHKRALDYFTTVSPHSPDWYYHALASNEEQGLASWIQAIQTMGPNQGKILLQVAYDNTLRLSPKGCAIRDYEQGLFNYKSIEWLNATGNVQQATVKRKEALENFQSALTLFQQVGDSTGETLAQEAIDTLQQSSGTRPILLHYGQIVYTPPLANEQLRFSDSPARNFSVTSAVFGSRPASLIMQRGRMVLLVTLVCLVIVESIGIFSFQQIRRANANAIATGIAHAVKATKEAFATGTAEAQATLIAANPNPYHNSKFNTITIADPLTDNRQNIWSTYVSNDGSGECRFLNGSYHATIKTSGYFFSCIANNTNFSNFTFQVQMTIIKGDCGGIIFRADSANSKYYWFQICNNSPYGPLGSYRLVLYRGKSDKGVVNLVGDLVPYIEEKNTIAVIANNDLIELYMNKTLLAKVKDSTYSSGQIGVFADDEGTTATDVAFNDAKVWT